MHALDKGLLKVMSKMGISCLSSYQGAQIFEAIGIGQATIDRWFPGTASRIGGIGLAEIAREALHAARARGYREPIDVDAATTTDALDVGGVYAWRVGGERHLWSPKTVASLQKAVRLQDAKSYDDYARAINDQGDLALHAPRLLGLAPAPPSPCRSTRSSRPRRSSGASRPAR